MRMGVRLTLFVVATIIVIVTVGVISVVVPKGANPTLGVVTPVKR